MGYIYKITNKINGHVYIGQTKKDYAERWEEHIKAAFSSAPSYQNKRYSFQEALSKYGVDNFRFEVLEEIPNSLLDEREKFWITKENSYYDGYNETLGGGGTVRYDYDAIYQDYLKTHNILMTAKNCCCGRDTVRSAILANGVKPIDVYNQDSHSLYNYQEIAEAYQRIQNIRRVAELYGCDIKVVSNACKRYNIPILSSGECTQKELGLEVSQIDLDTLKIIQDFPSASNAAIVVFNDKTKSANILACCKKKQKTAYGYGWIFKGDVIPLDLTTNNKCRKIRQLKKDTKEIINHFNSGIDAARALGKDESAAGVILRACRGVIKSAYGYLWEYED